MKWVWGILITLAFIFLGGLREIVFVNINEQIEFSAGRKEAYHVLPYLRSLSDYTISQLDWMKWTLTILTTVLYFLLSVFALRYALRRPRAVRWLIVLYLAGFMAAGLSYALGRMFAQPLLGYTIARDLMGGLQSPFPLMMLIPALYLMPFFHEASGRQAVSDGE